MGNKLEAILIELLELNEQPDISLRVQLLLSAVKLVSSRDDSLLLAVLFENLGDSLFHYFAGNRTENLEGAIEAYQTSLDLYHDFPYVYPERSGSILLNLGLVYRELNRGDNAENIERSIYSLHSALTVYKHERFSFQWAFTHLNLGSTYIERQRGDKAENIERSIFSLHSALTVYKHERFPIPWTFTHLDLSRAYMVRELGNPDENMKNATNSLQAVRTSRIGKELIALIKDNEWKYKNLKKNKILLDDFQREIISPKLPKPYSYGTIELSKINSDKLFLSSDKILEDIVKDMGYSGNKPSANPDRNSEELKQENTEAYAVARIKDIYSDQPLHIAETYLLEAGFQTDIPEGFEGKSVLLPNQEEDIKLDIVVHAEDIEIKPDWIQSYFYNRSNPSPFIKFSLTPTQAGSKQIQVEFFYERNWLANIQFQVEVTKAKETVLTPTG